MLTILKDLSKGTRVGAVALPCTVVLVWTLNVVNPELSGDDLATTVAVLLMVAYLYTRLIALVVPMVPDRPDSDRSVALSVNPLSFFAAGIFLVCIYATSVLLPSMAVYWLMDMTWSVDWAKSLVKASAIIAGCIATLICLKLFCWAAAVKIDEWSRRLMTERFPWSSGRNYGQI